MGMQWRPAMDIGHDGVDAEHQALFRLIERFLATPGREEDRERATALLGALRSRAQGHFAAEERLLAILRHPHLSWHREEHRKLLDGLDEVIRQVDAPDSVFDFAWVKAQADRFLPHWFFEHLGKADLPLKRDVRRARATA